ncbi:MAG: DUF4058 family protein [Chloroflexi bacterium]|nr:DUF4058 family protein [Chloroflexota bacterium]MCC6892085.1 DUF4058 family protein [Anaerolineae bacterium]
MSIHSEHNLYPGVNAHLNSALQSEPGGWQSFHSVHVVDILRGIDERLPAGYFARSEKTMQISEIIPPIGLRSSGGTVPDVTIFRAGNLPSASRESSPLTATAPARSTLIIETLTSEEYLPGIAIYQAGEGDLLGKPVTRIELLSPANKPRGAHHSHYLAKRTETFQSELRLVEIDYLHETSPLLNAMPSYLLRESGAFPYWVLVSDPRPTLTKGLTYYYEIGVDSPLPIITIPLSGSDTMTLDLGAVYNRTFASSRFFQMVVDYAQDPVHFERYTPTDQTLIQARMTAIAGEMRG